MILSDLVSTRSALLAAVGAAGLTLAACGQSADAPEPAAAPPAELEPAATVETASAELPDPGKIDAANWPAQGTTVPRDPAVEARVADILSQMTLEEKVGQVIQADINSVTPAQVREYNLGSVLNGGNSAPGGDNRAPAPLWLALADEFWNESIDTSDGGLGIPAIWGTDAVHGHNNIVGATVFPHNIGLGAANDPELMERIGQVTATEIRVTGQDWTFAPTIAVPRDDRWGRTYEGFSEDPEIVAAYGPPLVRGIQGAIGDGDFLQGPHTVATLKHYVGDGGTTDGVDQGDTAVTEAELRDIQAGGYPSAIAAGAQTVMASFNSFHGRKLHGHKELLTDVLRDRMGFDGFVVGDWNGHGQVAGCEATACAQSFNAGVDMFMAPDSWQGLYYSTLEQVQSGEITMERLDEAVTRILRVKIRNGLFEAGAPSTRALAGEYDLLGSDEHMAVAREAVRKSLVLLKNDETLPLFPYARVIVAGDGANDIGKQSGGWTLNWQGTGNTREDFPNGQSIFEGIQEAMAAGGGEAILSVDGSYEERPDAAIVVFGENPYAEFQGDRANVDFDPTDSLELLRELQAADIPTISVFITGRPLWMNPEINASDAFVVAWLPGTAGGGIADVIIGDENGEPRFDFQGKLSFSWPKAPDQTPLNVGDPDYDPLFAYGYGLSYAEPGEVGVLDEDLVVAAGTPLDRGEYFLAGVAQAPMKAYLADETGAGLVAGPRAQSPASVVSLVAADWQAQEDMRILTFMEAGALSVTLPEAMDFTREANGEMSLAVTYNVPEAPSGSVSFFVGGDWRGAGALDVTEQMAGKAGQGWQTSVLRLSCFGDAGADLSDVTTIFGVTGDGGASFELSEVRLAPNDEGLASCEL